MTIEKINALMSGYDKHAGHPIHHRHNKTDIRIDERVVGKVARVHMFDDDCALLFGMCVFVANSMYVVCDGTCLSDILSVMFDHSRRNKGFIKVFEDSGGDSVQVGFNKAVDAYYEHARAKKTLFSASKRGHEQQYKHGIALLGKTNFCGN